MFNILRTYQTVPHSSCLSLYNGCEVDSDAAVVIRAAPETPQTRWSANDTRFLLTLWRPGGFRQRCPQIWCPVGRTPSWLVARLLLPVSSPRGRDTEALWASFVMTLIPSRGPPSPDLIVSPAPRPRGPLFPHTSTRQARLHMRIREGPQVSVCGRCTSWFGSRACDYSRVRVSRKLQAA